MKAYFFKYKYLLLAYFITIIASVVLLQIFGNNQFSLTLNKYHNAFFDVFFKYTTYFGEAWFGVPACIVLLIFNRKTGIVLSIISIGSTLISQFNKHLVFNDALRPASVLKDYPLNFVDGVEMAYFNSFPSGHTTFAFTVFIFFALQSKKAFYQICFLFIAILVAFSRIYLLQHFLIDTIVGSLIGFACAIAGNYFLESYNNKTIKD